MLSGAWRLLTGRPLRSSEAEKEEISAPEGLAALSLDALTSVAYGPEAIVLIAAAAEARNLVVLHYDADFDRIAAVTSQPTQWVVATGSVN